MGDHKRRVHEILDPGEGRMGRAVNLALMALIILNIITVVLETVEGIYASNRGLFRVFGAFSVLIFSAEYLLRVWSIDEDERYSHPVWGRLRYAATPLAIIDLMVILPVWASLALPEVAFIRGARILWVFRLLKIGRYSDSLRSIERVVRSQKDELAVSLSAIIFFMLLSATIIYFLEHDAQPENFPSIPATMWWAVLIMTTIGYGDVYPVTLLGKVIGSLIIILGVATFSLPTAILASGFVDEIQRKREEKAGEWDSPDDGGGGRERNRLKHKPR